MTEAVVVDRVRGHAGELVLLHRGAHYEIVANGSFLMDTHDGTSERLLVTAAADQMPPGGRLLIAGLGVGFSLAAAVAHPAVRSVEVVEREPAILRWCAGPLREVHGGALDDARVRVHEADIVDWLAAAPAGSLDAICLDVDNGPAWLVTEANARLYDTTGLRGLHRVLAPGGVLAVWSAAPSPAFEARMRTAFDDVRTVAVPVGRGAPDVVLLGRAGRALPSRVPPRSSTDPVDRDDTREQPVRVPSTEPSATHLRDLLAAALAEAGLASTPGSSADGVPGRSGEVPPAAPSGAALPDDRQRALDRVAVAAQARAEVDALVAAAVAQARQAGCSWDDVQTALGRVPDARPPGAAPPDAGPATPAAAAAPATGAAAAPGMATEQAARTVQLAPLNILTEMAALHRVEVYGWHSVAHDATFHVIRQSDVQWEHARVAGLGRRRRELLAQGWQQVGAGRFPWGYLARPTDRPALPDPADAHLTVRRPKD